MNPLRLILIALIVITMLTAAWTTAAGPAAESRSYIYVYVEGGSAHGQLTMIGNRFTIHTFGESRHICHLSGALHWSDAGATASDGDCHISVSRSKDALNLRSSGTAEACSSLCGVHTRFDGEYRRQPIACMDRQRIARIEQSHKQYAAKSYDAALATLSAVLNECDIFMDWIERDKTKNDLARIAYLRGDSAQCVAELSDTFAVHARKGRDVLSPPSDTESYQSIGDAILHNLALCQTLALR